MGMYRQTVSALLAGTMVAGTMIMVPAAARADDVAQAGAASPVVTEALLSDTYARLQRLSEDGLSLNGYQLAKALSFLEVARREFYMRNHSGIVFEFVESAQIIAESLEQGVPIGTGNRRYEASESIMPRLWQRIALLKRSSTFACAGDRVAQAEVLLITAGNDQKILGWRAAQARVRMAEDWLARAEQVSSC